MSKIKLQSEYEDLDKYQIYKDIVYYKKDTNIFHNPYGPSVITKNGNKIYHIENKRHRLDGPAMIYSNGEEEYWINGKYLTKEEFEKHPKRLEFLGKGHLACLV